MRQATPLIFFSRAAQVMATDHWRAVDGHSGVIRSPVLVRAVEERRYVAECIGASAEGLIDRYRWW